MGNLNTWNRKIGHTWAFQLFSQISNSFNFSWFWHGFLIRFGFSDMFCCLGAVPELHGIPREQFKLTLKVVSYANLVWSCIRSPGFRWSWEYDQSPQNTQNKRSWKRQLNWMVKLWERGVQLTVRQIRHFPPEVATSCPVIPYYSSSLYIGDVSSTSHYIL